MEPFVTEVLRPITIKNLGFLPAAGPLRLEYSDIMQYRGYGRQVATCRLQAYESPGIRVFIVTEISENKGCSITNNIEEVAVAIEQRLELPHVFGPTTPLDKTYVLIEHYAPDSYSVQWCGAEDFSIVKFKMEMGFFHYYEDPDWIRVEKPEIERLIGGPLD